MSVLNSFSMTLFNEFVHVDKEYVTESKRYYF